MSKLKKTVRVIGVIMFILGILAIKSLLTMNKHSGAIVMFAFCIGLMIGNIGTLLEYRLKRATG